MALETIPDLPAGSAATGTELVEVSQLSATVDITATTISALASDNSYNDSAAGLVAAGFAVGDHVNVKGFTGNAANNIVKGVITALTTAKMTIGGADGNVIVDDAAGESVTIAKWESRRLSAQEIADLGGSGVPDGGDTGQVLGKLSGADGDANWIDQTGGGGGGGAPFNGARIVRSADSASATGDRPILDSASAIVEFDTAGFYDPVNSWFEIPSGVEKVVVSANVHIDGGGGTKGMRLRHTDSGGTVLSEHFLDIADFNFYPITTGVLNVTTGDLIKIEAYTSGSHPFMATNKRTWASIQDVTSAGGVGDTRAIVAGGVFTVAAGVLTVLESHNIASITRIADGRYKVLFNSPLDDANYHVSAISQYNLFANDDGAFPAIRRNTTGGYDQWDADGFDIQFMDGDGTFFDVGKASFTVTAIAKLGASGGSTMVARAYMNGAFTSGSVGFQDYAMDTVDIDPEGWFDAGSGGFTPTAPGSYQVNARVRCNTPAFGAIFLSVNGTTVRGIGNDMTGQTAVQGSAVVELDGTETVSISAYTTTAGQTGTTGLFDTYLEVIGPLR